jgi:hypothetical protein
VRRAALALAFVAVASSCVQFTWRERRVGRALPDEHVAWAVAERPSLDAALARLGAPTIVRDREEQGTELLWVWERDVSYDLGVSVPLDNGSLSFDGNQTNSNAVGLRLLFDREGRCTKAVSGHVLAAP